MTGKDDTGDGHDPFDGARGMSQRESIPTVGISEPDRDISSVTDTLESVEEGDWVKLGMAINHPEDGFTGGTSVMEVHAVETDVARFDRRVSFIHHDGEVHRLYMTGIGNDELDPWEILSCPYVPEIGLVDMSDFAAHGWVVGAKVVDRG